MSAATLWCRRFAHLIRELARFAVVGAIGFLVTDGAFNLMISEHQAALTANAVATLAASVVTFLGSRYWTFRHRKRTGLGCEAVTFIVLNLVGILIQQACLELAARELEADLDQVTLNAAFLAGVGLATGFRFWSYRRYVWPREAGKAVTSAASAWPPARNVIFSPEVLMRILRTPDERFAGLPGYPFEPRYVEVGDGLRVHYLDEGPAGAAPVLLLHGEPSWCYLYRTMIPVLAAAGHRCVAPDLIGFGRSDKPAEPGDYSYQRHVDWMAEVIFDRLGLADVTLVGQDWGGLIGLRLVAAEPDRFARVVAANTALPTGDFPLGEAFLRWQRFARESPAFDIGRIISNGTVGELPADVIAAYDAPFPDDSYKAGARAFPALVPTSPDDPAHDANTAAWEVLLGYGRPFLCAFSDGDPITRGGEGMFIGRVPGTAGQPHTTIKAAGHFLQEDKGELLAQVIADFIAAT